MRALILFFVISGIAIQANSQVVSKRVLTTYSPGVISRLYDIVKTTALSDEQQVQIANQIDSADKVIAENIIAGKSTAEIDKTLQIETLNIFGILGKNVLNYTAKKAEGFARAASDGEINFMQENYNIDTSLTKGFREIQYNKYKSSYQKFLLYEFMESKATEQISKTAKRYDSLSFNLYRTLYANKYLDKYLKEIKKVNPSVPDSVTSKIAIAFNKSSGKNLFADWGQTMLDALQHVYPDTAIIAHFYKPAIERQASFLAAGERYMLINKDHVSHYGYESIYPVLKQELYHRVLLEYTYGGNTQLRDSLIKRSSEWYDSVVTASLLRDGSLLAYNQFSIALKYKNQLNLSPALTDTLLWHAMHLRHIQDSILSKEPYAKLDFKVYEATYLNSLLSEDEYTRLLTIKNKSQAQMDADNDWEDMQTWGIAPTLDKETVRKQLFLYYLTKWNAYYRMANDKIKQEANLKVLKDNQPNALKMLSAAKKLPAPVNENASLKLSW